MLYLTNYLESAGWVGIVIRREGVFQVLPRNKITEAFSRIWDAGNSKQVALLANARASFGLKFRGIDNGARSGVRKVFFRWAVTAFAGYRFFRKRRRTILVHSVQDVKRGT